MGIESVEGHCVSMSLSHQEKNNLEMGMWFSVLVLSFSMSTFPCHQKLNI